MATREGNGTQSKTSSAAPVKWTLVEAEPEKPEGRRGKQNYGRTRGHGAGSSSSAGNWRSGRDTGRGQGGQGHSGSFRGNRRGGSSGGGSGSGGMRHNHGHGRGRGHGGGRPYVGATYYPNPQQYEPSLQEQQAYMTNMAVRQIEFYFTVENLCRDIFMRSYMDEEGYIPIAFVANFPGVARFGVELQDITAGILASDFLEVDVENETMRMREGWQVWLLPNQATGKRGVPRYIKVDATTLAEGTAEAEAEDAEEQTQESVSPATTNVPDGNEKPCEVLGTDETPTPGPRGDVAEGTIEAEEEASANSRDETIIGAGGRANLEKRADVPGAKTHSSQPDKKNDLLPSAPAWTPGDDSKTIVAEEAHEASSKDESKPKVDDAEDSGDICESRDNEQNRGQSVCTSEYVTCK